MKSLLLVAAVGVLVAGAMDARAAVVNVFSGDPTWTSSGNTGGGASSIAATPLLDGDGAVSIAGDSTRFNIANANYGALASLSAFSFQWAVTQTGAGVVSAQAPALRLFTFDPVTNRQIQFIWEDGEQSNPVFVNGAGSLNTTYTGDFFGAGSRVYARTVGLGRGLYNSTSMIAGSDAAQSLSGLIATLNSPNAAVFSFGMGVGSSVGDFRGFADRVTIGFGGADPTTYNFRAAATVPEPMSLLLVGLALAAAAGVSVRRRSQG